MNQKWDQLRLSSTDTPIWETFHENSKTSPFSALPPEDVILQKMARLWESLPFPQYPAIALPPASELSMSLGSAIDARRSARGFSRRKVPLKDVAALVRGAYGVTATNDGGVFPRPFRAVPSGGALFPLDLFIHATRVEDLAVGIYHYDPTRGELRHLREGNQVSAIAEAMVQPELALDASLVVWMTAVFERTVFKYGDRGYRFALIEAGHVGQNLALVATALGLGCVTLGGYFDRRMDDLLGIDGITHSTLYMASIGAVDEGG